MNEDCHFVTHNTSCHRSLCDRHEDELFEIILAWFWLDTL